MLRADNSGLGRIDLDRSAVDPLSRHPWPGNVRELANLVERLAIMHPGGIIGFNELPAKFRHLSDEELPGYLNDSDSVLISAEKSSTNSVSISSNDPGNAALPVEGIDLKGYLATLEQSLIEQALTESDSVVARAAGMLQIRRTTLVEKMRKYGIQRK